MKTALFDHPRAMVLAVLILLLGGISSLFTMPQTEDPRPENRFAFIVAPYPGASAERVESLVTQRIEEVLRTVDGVDEVQSLSRAGSATIFVNLADSVSDGQERFSLLRDRLGDVAPLLPPDAGTPRLIDDRSFAYTVVAAVTWESDAPVMPLILQRTAAELASRLRSLPNAEYVGLHGITQEEIAVTLDEEAAAALGLDETDIAAALSRGDAKATAGTLLGEDEAYILEMAGDLATLSDIREALIEIDGDAALRIGDVAKVERALKRPGDGEAYVDGARAVMIGIRMRDSDRIVNWAARANETLDAFAEELPQGLGLVTVFDQSVYAAKRFDILVRNLLTGAVLVVAILFLTLGIRAAGIVTLAIPLTVSAALTVLAISGVKLNQISITGLIVALGLLVDAAIVVCDAVARRLRAGLTPREAMAAAVQRLWRPLGSSTVTTVLAFLPITFLGGPAGEFVSPLAFAVIATLIASFVLALTVVAGLGARFLGAEAEQATWGERLTAPPLSRLSALLRTSLARPRLSAALALAPAVAGFALVGTLPSQFFPVSDREQFHVEIFLDPQKTLAATREAALAADAIIEAHPMIRSAHWTVGESMPAFYYNVEMTTTGAPNYAHAMVTATRLGGLGETMNTLQDRLAAALPGAQVLVNPLVQGPGSPAPVVIRIAGPDLDELRRLGEEARLILMQDPEMIATSASLTGSAPALYFDAHDDAVRRAGLDTRGLADGLRARLQGIEASFVVEGEETVPIVVRLGDQARGDITALRSTPFAEEGGAATPLSSLGEIRLRATPASISRFQGERVNMVHGYIRADAISVEAAEGFAARAEAAGFSMPPGYEWSLGGDVESRADAVRGLLRSTVLVAAAAVVVVVMTFNSFRMSAIVFAVALLSMGLGLLSLRIAGHPFGFLPIVALMGLVGVAINAAIIILTGLKEDPDARRGDTEAVAGVVSESARHIISTTLTTFAGFVPLMLTEGAFWPPFAVVVAGGVLLSSALSFFFVPQAYLIVRRRGEERSIEPAAAPLSPSSA